MEWTAKVLVDAKHWKDWTKVVQDKASLLEKENNILKASKKTTVTAAELLDIKQLKTELRANIKYNLGWKTNFFHKITLIWSTQENTICWMDVSQMKWLHSISEECLEHCLAY